MVRYAKIHRKHAKVSSSGTGSSLVHGQVRNILHWDQASVKRSVCTVLTSIYLVIAPRRESSLAIVLRQELNQ